MLAVELGRFDKTHPLVQSIQVATGEVVVQGVRGRQHHPLQLLVYPNAGVDCFVEYVLQALVDVSVELTHYGKEYRNQLLLRKVTDSDDDELPEEPMA